MNKKFKKNTPAKVFMAFAGGAESTEGGIVKRYIGVAPVAILAVNPNKEQLEKIYGTKLENSPEYIGESEIGPEGAKKKVTQVRLDFIVQSDEEKCGHSMLTKIGFFLKKDYRYNREGNKVQIVNEYGEFTWVPIHNADGSQNTNLSGAPEWFEGDSRRPAYIGEEELTGFLKYYMNIPVKSYRKKNGEVVTIAKKEDAYARLDGITNYFKGEVQELRDIVAMQPKNRVKGLFGVKTTSEGKMYQDVYIQKFLKNNVTDYSALDAHMQDRKAAGSYPNTEFKVQDLAEYGVEATKFSEPAQAMPTPEADAEWFNP